jgi:glycosyltransferase involved in cell wall biosynthesis
MLRELGTRPLFIEPPFSAMPQLIFVYPGDLTTPTGGYAYDRKIIEELERLGWQIQLISLGEGYPFPTDTQIEFARSTLMKLTQGVPMVIDGLALGALPNLAAELATRHPLIALIHHPLAFELGLTEAEIKSLMLSETQALQQVNQVIVTSPATGRDLSEHYGITSEIINVILPGTDRMPFTQARKQSNTDHHGCVHLLSVGSIIPRKGFDYLMAALAPLLDLQWTLTIAGDTSRNTAAYERLMVDIQRFQLEERVKILGVVSNQELDLLYTNADVFVLPSLFEGYGMVYAEAMSYGLPIIATTGGAIPDTVPPEAGLLIPPGDIPNLTAALKTLIQDSSYRSRLSGGALQAASKQPTWDHASQLFATVLTHLI